MRQEDTQLYSKRSRPFVNNRRGQANIRSVWLVPRTYRLRTWFSCRCFVAFL